MRSWKDTLEAWFSAVAFAEAGEHETAIQLTAPGTGTAVEWINIIEHLNCVFAAAAFAEADCHQMAREILNPCKKKQSFLDTVGLRGVRVRMGRVPIPQGSFLELAGLVGVPVRFGKALI